jgi:methionyl-tRNA formyltransferase
MNSLKIVFLGTPDFAVESLKAIHISPHQVVGVVTMPDKKMGRGRKLTGSAVKNFAVENDLLVMQPEKLKNPEFISQLSSLNADLFIVVAFRMLPEMVWNMPPLGTVNLHGSLLPQYRGAAPINWAIINGDKETGVTIFKLKHEIDTGDILLRKSIPITATDDAESVHDKLMNLGAKALLDAVNNIADGDPEYLPQITDTNLRNAPKIFKDTCKIDWNTSVANVHNFVRGLSPYPAAWTSLLSNEKDIALKVYKTTIELAEVSKPGIFDTDNKTYIKISAKDGWIHLTEIQLAGKKRMQTADLLRGFSFEGDWKISE